MIYQILEAVAALVGLVCSSWVTLILHGIYKDHMLWRDIDEHMKGMRL